MRSVGEPGRTAPAGGPRASFLALALVGAALVGGACLRSSGAVETTPEATHTSTSASPSPVATAAATPSPVPTPSPEPEPDPESTATSAPPDALFVYTYAQQLLRANLYEEAIPQFDIVLRVLPDLALAYHGRGVALYHEEQLELALEDFNKAIELKPDLARAYLSRGTLLEDQGEQEAADRDFREALSLYAQEGNSQGVNAAGDALSGEGP